MNKLRIFKRLKMLELKQEILLKKIGYLANPDDTKNKKELESLTQIWLRSNR